MRERPPERIPIVRLGDLLLVTIQVEMHDRLATVLEEDLTAAIVKHRAKGVLIDISSVEVIDSFTARMMSEIATISRLLAAQTVVVGMRPSVAITLVEMGLLLSGVQTALNIDLGMALLQSAPGETPSRRSDEDHPL